MTNNRLQKEYLFNSNFNKILLFRKSCNNYYFGCKYVNGDCVIVIITFNVIVYICI